MSTLTHKSEKLRNPSMPSKLTNLQQRWRTALIFGPITLLLVVLGDIWFFALAFVLAMVGILEFCNLGRNRRLEARAVVANVGLLWMLVGFALGELSWIIGALGVTFAASLAWSLWAKRREWALADALMTTAGVVYVGVTAGLLIRIRATPDGLIWLLLVLFLTWGTDTFAFFGGRAWGKHLLAPRISPKKTVEGAVVGMIGGFGLGLLLLLLSGQFEFSLLPLLILSPMIAVLGDLSESALKRAFNVKDSHLSHFNLFPGHGGVLDRTDSLILVTWFSAIVLVSIGILA